MRLFSGIKPRLRYVATLILVIILFALMNVAWLFPVVYSIRNNASDQALNIARRVRSDISNQFQLVFRDLETTADELSFLSLSQELILARSLRRIEGFKSVAIADLEGREFLKQDRFELIDQSAFVEHQGTFYFDRALAGIPSLGQVFITGDFEPHILIAVPRQERGVVKSVLIADFNLRNLINKLDTINVPDGEIFVVDEFGFQILHRDITELLKRVYMGDSPWINKVIKEKQVLTGIEQGVNFQDLSRKDKFTVGIPFENFGWGIFVEQLRSNALAEERRTVIIALVLFAAGLLASGVVVYSNLRLRGVGERLRDLINENYQSSKMLVKRDLELTEANTRLEELDQVKSEFVSVAAHQLRTPLTGIRWSLHTLIESEGKLKPGQEKTAKDTLSLTLSAIDLINDLLNVARIEEGRAGLNLKRQPIKPIIAAEAEKAAIEAERTGIMFSAFMPDSLPECDVDAEKFGIVVENILNNAIKYTPRGGRVTLSVAVSASQVEISVIDTGIGIPKTQQHRMFSQFFRASNARRAAPTGTGLGLFMTRNIMEKHGGSISFISEEGQGTSMRVFLPILQDALPIHGVNERTLS